MANLPPSQFVADICRALGLPKVRSMNIRIAPNEVVEVVATFPLGDGLTDVIKRYRLTAEPIDEKNASGQVR